MGGPDRAPQALLLTAFALALAGCTGAGAPRLSLVRGEGGARDAFVARGIEREFLASPEAAAVEWSRVFEVFVEGAAGAAGEGLPAIAGSASCEGGVLRFEPRFPLEPGIRYRARLRPGPWIGRVDGGGPALEEVFALAPRPLEPRTVVERVYPTAGVLPENQLKFYIHFSRPMRRGQAYGRIHLLDAASGKEVDAPFLELGEELWDPSGTRFTLFFDPGRVKRGLLQHEELGAPLEAGKRYTLVIDGGWPDAEGAPLRAAHRKEFEVRGPDRRPPDPRLWRIAPAAAGTNEPLEVAFPEPLDHALLHRLLDVRDPAGELVAGEVLVGAEEREWRFRPQAPWKAGRHHLLVETTLEDLAGNSVGRPFEVDADRGIQGRIEPKVVTVPFEVTGPKSP